MADERPVQIVYNEQNKDVVSSCISEFCFPVLSVDKSFTLGIDSKHPHAGPSITVARVGPSVISGLDGILWVDFYCWFTTLLKPFLLRSSVFNVL